MPERLHSGPLSRFPHLQLQTSPCIRPVPPGEHAVGASVAFTHPAVADTNAHETHAKEATEKHSASHHLPTTAAKRLSKLPCFMRLLCRMKRLRPVLDSPVPEAETISASPRSILKTSLKTSKTMTDIQGRGRR